MNTRSKLGISLAIAIAAFTTTASASDNWVNGTGEHVWKNGGGDNLCWQNNYWTAATAAGAECGAPVAQAPKEQPRQVEQVRPVTPAIVSEKVSFNADAFFDFDKYALKPEGKRSLDELAGKIGGINFDLLIAVGHTDSVGSKAYNQKLSERRAAAVKAYLVSKGVPADRIQTEGRNFSQPVASNATRDGRARNRRVEVELIGTTR